MQSWSVWSSWNEVLSFENSHFRFGQFRRFSERTLGILGQPSVPGFLNIRSSHVSLDRMLPRRGFFDASQKGFFSFQVILMGLLCAYNRSRGDLGEINTGAQLLPSSEGSLGSRCRSRKLGKCLTLLYQGLILTRRTGQIDPHSTQVEACRRNKIDQNNIGCNCTEYWSYSQICIPASGWKMNKNSSTQSPF